MNRCEVCKVNVHPQHRFCPLCGKDLGTPAHSATLYPVYTLEKHGFSVWKLLLFIVICVSFITAFINIMTIGSEPALWAVTVIISLITPFAAGFTIWSKNISSGGKILYLYLILSVYLTVIDILNGFAQWSTTYVIPFLTIAVTLLLTIFALTNNANFKEYLGKLVTVFFFSLCPVLIFIFSLSSQAWTSFSAALFCLLTIIGLLIFKGSVFKREIKKKFHM